MEPALQARLSRALARPEIGAIDPDAVARLAVALDTGDPPVRAGRHGSVVGYDPRPGRRRLVSVDRRDRLVAACRWRPDGSLAWAKCLTAAGQWIGIEPAAATHPGWDRCDRLWLLAPDEAWAPERAITLFEAVDYARPDAIPALLEPARLPSGAGTAVLNLIAELMRDQGVARVRYRGPYPTEQLFTALLECFRYDVAADDPLGRFMEGGEIDWLPAPFETHHVAPGVAVQMRHGIDKVVLDGAAFYRPDWQGVLRREPRVVREAGDRAVCSLWALGQPIEHRLVLDATGEILERPAPRPDPTPPAPLAPLWAPALAELVARESAPALAAPLREVLTRLHLQWGAVPGDLLSVSGDTARISRRLREVGRDWVRQAEPGPERARRAIGLVLEIARLVGPLARTRAQERLAALPAEAQAAALRATADEGPLPESVGKLLVLVAGGQS